ncbi:MAG: IMP cyclohydrolase [Acidobacteriota bacterium]|nr:IMP cyclohydrolase [Acidobacteriota bacterium]
MSSILKVFERIKYLGRIIIIGKDSSGENIVIIYAITGRSPSSQARKILFKKNVALVLPTDTEILKKGNIDLLIYPAVIISNGIAVSNGKQTKDIAKNLQEGKIAIDVLKASLQDWDYEPDKPAYTPRISGCVLSPNEAALSIIKRAGNGDSEKLFFKFPLIQGKGKMIATYSGENKDPLPSFQGEPLDIELNENTAKKTANAVYQALGPKEKENDLRVSVVCVYANVKNLDEYHVSIINKQGRTDK